MFVAALLCYYLPVNRDAIFYLVIADFPSFFLPHRNIMNQQKNTISLVFNIFNGKFLKITADFKIGTEKLSNSVSKRCKLKRVLSNI